VSLQGGYTNKVGTYRPTIVVANDPTTKKVITAKVIDDSTGPGGGDSDNGAKYSLTVHNVRLTTTQASQLAALASNPDQYANELINRAGATAYIRTGSTLARGGTAVLDDDGGFATGIATSAVHFTDGSVFNVTFIVDEEPTVSATAKFIISNGNPPVLSVPAWREVAVGANFGEDAYMNRVTYSDVEDPQADLVLTHDNPVNTAVAGIYTVTYKVTDTDGNVTTKKGNILVNDGNYTITPNYVVYAHSFTVDTDSKPAFTADEILKLSEAKAWDKDTLAQVPVTVTNTNGYDSAKKAGVYTPTVAPVANTREVRAVKATVTAPGAKYLVTFDANGGYLTGPNGIYVQEPSTALNYLPSSPIRTGYTFTHWSTSPTGGSQFTSSTTVTRPTTVYAQWTKNPDPPVTPAPVVNVTPAPVNVTPAPVYVNTSPGAASPTYVTVNNPETESGATTPPTTNIGEDKTPTTSGAGVVTTQPVVPEETHWSLFDLCAVILALLLALIFLVKFFFDRKKAKEYEEEPIDQSQWAAMTAEQRAAFVARREADRQTYNEEQQQKANKPKSFYVNIAVLLIVVLAFIEGLVILLTTQDFTSSMVIIDQYSIPLSLVVFVQLVTPMVAALLRKNQTSNGSTQPPQQPMTA
jgi:hypothetical protein